MVSSSSSSSSSKSKSLPTLLAVAVAVAAEPALETAAEDAVVLDDVTELFWLLYASCEKNQPGLQEELLKTCTIKNPEQWKCDVAGRYDGVQAMKMVMSVHLKARSKPDYLYYEKALRLTERNKLSSGPTDLDRTLSVGGVS